MEWYWVIILLAVYGLGGVYFGTRFRQWGRHTLCANRRSNRDMCDACHVSTAAVLVLWPIVPPLIMFVTWLFRTARHQSRYPADERKKMKQLKRQEAAKAEQAAIAAEEAAVDAKLKLTRKKQELLHAASQLQPEGRFEQPNFP